MAQSSSIPIRTGYLRTVSHPATISDGFVYLPTFVLQTSQTDIGKGEPRHRFLVGAANDADAYLLDSLIQISSHAPPDETKAIGRKHYAKHLHRSDIELRMSKPRASTATGRKLLKRCKEDGITAIVSGENDDECDKAMLEESDYLIDLLSHQLSFAHWNWLHNHARPGIPRENLLNHQSFDKSKLMFWNRLASRYCGYGWKESSGAYHGNGEWDGCRLCGGNCKRRQCKGTGICERVNERKKYEEAEERRREDELKVLETDRWRSLTARELTWWLCHCSRGEGLHSVDTFSGE